jgi:hypothetical protein
MYYNTTATATATIATATESKPKSLLFKTIHNGELYIISLSVEDKTRLLVVTMFQDGDDYNSIPYIRMTGKQVERMKAAFRERENFSSGTIPVNRFKMIADGIEVHCPEDRCKIQLMWDDIIKIHDYYTRNADKIAKHDIEFRSRR